MIANAIAPDLISSKDELVAYLVKAMADGATPFEAAREAADSLIFDEDLREELVLLGLTRVAGGAAAHGRHAAPNDDGGAETLVFQRRGMTPAQRRDVLDRVLRVGADGVMKRLLDFTLADCMRARDLAASQSAGWQKQEEAMGVAVGLLNLHKVDQVSSLPPKALSTLRGAMTDLWR